jgi:kumamolisin
VRGPTLGSAVTEGEKGIGSCPGFATRNHAGGCIVTYVALPGSERLLLPDSRPAGPIDPCEIADVTVKLRSRGDLGQLESWAYEQAARPLAEREYMTHQQLLETYGARKQDLDHVETFAHQHDLVVVHRSAAERSVVLRGRLGDLRAAFPADIQLYHHATGSYRGRTGEISVPQEFDAIITGIFGFDTRPKHRGGHYRKQTALAGPGTDNGLPATEFASRYEFPTNVNGTQLDGTGQTIAIIELGGGFRASDLSVFFAEIGASSPSVAAISVDHAVNNPTTADSADGEVMLDIEVAGAVVPKAQFAIYFGPNVGDKGFLDAISAAVHDSERAPSVISISWGEPEDLLPQQSIDAYHQLFVAAAALGITVCAASGDHGTADEDGAHWDHKIHVNHPTSDSYVLACGGTQVQNGQDVVWNDGTPFDPSTPGGGGWASGGGISVVFPVPDYQQSADLPVSIDTGSPGRGVPDIAMSATNYFTRVDSSEGASGGTSAVAPLMAALIARLNQAKAKRVGFINPFLYASVDKSIFHDVLEGTNAITETVKGYDAGPGWDACTGLGTPDGQAILQNV